MALADMRVTTAGAAAALTLLAAGSAWAQNPSAPVQQQVEQGATTGSGQPAQPTVDKTQYNVFNPTPDDQMRPLTTDRPGKAQVAQTVDAGHIQFESDFWNYTFDRYSPYQATLRQYSIGTPNLKLGLTNWAELDVATALYSSSAVRSRNGQGIARGYGIGDLFLGGKINLFGNDGGDQAMGLIGFVKLPTAARNLGNDMAEFLLTVPFTTALPRDFSLTLQPSVNLLRNTYKQGLSGDYQFTVGLSRPVFIETVSAGIEVALDFPADHNAGLRHSVGPTLQWLVTPTLQLDVGANIGITKAAPDYNPYAGISVRF